MSTRSELLLGLLLLCMPAVGCVAHFDPRSARVRSVPVVQSALVAEPLYVTFAGTAIVDWRLGEQPSPLEREAIVEALRRSGAFAEVRADPPPAGALVLEIDMEHWDDALLGLTGNLQGSHKWSIANIYLSIPTLTLIPYAGKHPVSIAASLERAGEPGSNGERLGRWVLSESVPSSGPGGYTTIRPQYTHLVGWPALLHNERRNAEVMATAVVTWVLHGIRNEGIEL